MLSQMEMQHKLEELEQRYRVLLKVFADLVKEQHKLDDKLFVLENKLNNS